MRPGCVNGVMLSGARRQSGPGGLIETYICRMWAILLGCILWEARCNNRKAGRRRGEKEREREVGGGGHRVVLRTTDRTAAMPYCWPVYGMCCPINNQFMGA